MGDPDFSLDVSSLPSWDVAVRYHEFKSKMRSSPARARLRALSADAILRRAREVLGSVVHITQIRSSAWDEVPANALHAEFDLDETLDHSPLPAVAAVPLTCQDIWYSYEVTRPHSVILAVDTSLSMTGEKLALTAVALAVVLLQFPDDLLGIVAFENEAKVVKRPEERISIETLVGRFLDVPAQGYTHIEDGMRAALKQVDTIRSRQSGRPVSTVLLTDGKYTAGRDPAFLAPKFPHLVVMKMGAERASLALCRELAQKGRGALREVANLEELPQAMYGVVKELIRGFSHG